MGFRRVLDLHGRAQSMATETVSAHEALKYREMTPDYEHDAMIFEILKRIRCAACDPPLESRRLTEEDGRVGGGFTNDDVVLTTSHFSHHGVHNPLDLAADGAQLAAEASALLR